MIILCLVIIILNLKPKLLSSQFKIRMLLIIRYMYNIVLASTVLGENSEFFMHGNRSELEAKTVFIAK